MAKRLQAPAASTSNSTHAKRLRDHAGRAAAAATPLPTILAPNCTGQKCKLGRDFGTSGGKRLGGGVETNALPTANFGLPTADLGLPTADFGQPTASTKRQTAASAAELRLVSQPGISAANGAKLQEQRQKDELLGKLTQHYARQSLDMPMALQAASADQLKKYWQSVQRVR